MLPGHFLGHFPAMGGKYLATEAVRASRGLEETELTLSRGENMSVPPRRRMDMPTLSKVEDRR